MGFLNNLFKKKEDSLINNIEKKALNGDMNSHNDDSLVDKIIITSPFEQNINIQSLEEYMIQVAKLTHSDLCIELSNILAAKYNLSVMPVSNNKLMADLNDKIAVICIHQFGKNVVLDYCNGDLRELNELVNEIDEKIAQLQLGPLLHGKRILEILHKSLKKA